MRCCLEIAMTLPVFDFERDDAELEKKGHCISQNHGQRIDPDSVDQPQEHADRERQHHPPG